MKIILVASRLNFVSLLTGKVHARDSIRPEYAHLTMCGRTIPSGASLLPTHKLDDKQVCGRCLASLRTYTGGKVRFEREAGV